MAVVTLLQLAQYFVLHQPTRTVILNFNNGEEDGLHGARLYVSVLESSRIKCSHFLVSWSIRGQSSLACSLTLKEQEQEEEPPSSGLLRHASQRRSLPPHTRTARFCSQTYSHPALCVP